MAHTEATCFCQMSNLLSKCLNFEIVDGYARRGNILRAVVMSQLMVASR